jgi:hypothetical protein
VRGRLRFAVATLAVACASAPADPGPPPGPESLAFVRRVESFYGALRGRGIEAFETYEDEKLRSYFATPEEFSDWYAAVANRVRASDLRFGRPEEVRIREIHFEGGDTARVEVVLIGPHERPLRLRPVEIEFEDVWERSNGTWMLRPDRL